MLNEKKCWICESTNKTVEVSFKMFIHRRGWQKNERDICPKCLKAMQNNDENFRNVEIVK